MKSGRGPGRGGALEIALFAGLRNQMPLSPSLSPLNRGERGPERARASRTFLKSRTCFYPWIIQTLLQLQFGGWYLELLWMLELGRLVLNNAWSFPILRASAILRPWVR